MRHDERRGRGRGGFWTGKGEGEGGFWTIYIMHRLSDLCSAD